MSSRQSNTCALCGYVSHLPHTAPPCRRIFCNRSLNMKSIAAVGFDMDYTLAQYKPEAFETLAHEQTVDKLVKFFGYPKVRGVHSNAQHNRAQQGKCNSAGAKMPLFYLAPV